MSAVRVRQHPPTKIPADLSTPGVPITASRTRAERDARGIRTTSAVRRVGLGSLCGWVCMSVRLKGLNMVLLECWILGILAQIAVAHRKDIQLASHEAAEPVLWLTDHRLAPHVEAR